MGPDLPLAEFADAPRSGDWSLRSALVRFAQPEPTRAGAVLELVRRTEGALKHADDDAVAALAPVVDELDAIAEALVAWAADRHGPPPVEAVEHHGTRAHARLEALGVPRESGPPPGGRRRG
jgi:hypothetical protein